MSEKISIIEPLFHQLGARVKSGEPNCLGSALTLFGSESDIDAVSGQIRAGYARDRTLLIDFTPFVSLGTKTRWKKLEQVSQEVPFFAVVRKGAALEHLKGLSRIPTVVCDENHNITNILTFDRRRRKSSLLRKNFVEIHRKWVETELEGKIANALVEPPEHRRYRRLLDDTWANLWIDVKSIVGNADEAFLIAYQMGYQLTRGYTQPLAEHGFVVGNNTAYILAGFLQNIFEDRQLVMIDRLGPYPAVSRASVMGLEKLSGRRFCIVEDVVSTGREIDLLILLLLLHNVEVERVITLFDLEIASSLLWRPRQLLSLCKPARRIKYTRLPKYKFSEESATSGDTQLR